MRTSPALLLALLVTTAGTLSTCLQPHAEAWVEGRSSDHLLQVLFGDSRQILANHMFDEADVYFHSGYYPSFFDQAHAPANARHMTHADSGADGHLPNSPNHHAHEDAEEKEHEKAMSFLHPPLDWIEAFGRHFAITTHTHLSSGMVREMLPWLRLSAYLDPHRIETYTVTAYWLRQDLHRTKEAEQFLREGLMANPSSYEILIDLGRLYYENYHDTARSRNLWQAALRRWMQQEAHKPKPDVASLGEITVRLAMIEEGDGHYAEAIKLLEMTIAHDASPNPEALRARIASLRLKLAARQPKAAPG